jgi:hypothetical protein
VSDTPGSTYKTEQLVSASEIAQIAQVKPSAVSNWRKRFPDFPASAGTAPSGGDLFLLSDVHGWLLSHDRAPKHGRREAMEQLWAVAERLRGQALAGDLIGAVASCAALLHFARKNSQLPPDHRQGFAEIAAWARTVTARLGAERPELGALFAPLTALEPQSLGLLLDSLVTFETAEELALVLDYALERGSRYSDFRSPEPAAAMLAELAEPSGRVFDPAVGSGEFLIQAARATQGPLDLYGQELNESTWRLALARLLLRDLEAQIQLGDSLAQDRFLNLRADVVMCEPTAGARTVDLGYAVGDPRWQLLGSLDAPPPRASDFTWLAHVIHHLAPDGRGYVILPAGSLFRGGIEARFRSELLRQGTIEAIVALPRGATSTTATGFVLWIVRPATPDPAPVLLIDGTGETALSQRLRSRLAETIRIWRTQPHLFEPTAGYARTVPVLELLAGDAALVPGRWLYQPAVVDTTALIEAVEQAERDLASAHTHLPPRPRRFTLTPTAEPPARVRVRELIDLGLVKLLRPARIKADDYGDEGLPVWLPGNINDLWRRDEPPRFVDPELADARSVTEPGDIVLTTIGGIRTRVDEEGGHVLATSLQALRLKPDIFDAHAVAALLTSEPNRRLLTGTTIPRVNVLELEIPRLDLATATQTGELLRALEYELETTNAVVARAETLRKAVVDALATGAATIGDLSKTDDD